jgi:nucleoside-diphosphate-sugar epimerase
MDNLKKNKESTCVVTGGAGFIGSHLVDALLDKGYKVFALDNLLTGNENNLVEAQKNPKFTFINYDVSRELPVLGHIDYIYHLASPASVPDYQKYPEETALVNTVGTRGLLKVAKAHGAKFLFTSTSEVYGDPKEHPQKETYWGNVNPNGIRACYDEAKRFGEMMTFLYVRNHGVDARVARIFNTYGPRMRPTDGRVISNFINQALHGKPMTVYGDGVQTRSLCYISDMVSGLIALMESEKSKGEVVNLGNPEEYTMGDLATKVKMMTGSASEITHTDLPPDDPTKRRPDITKAKTLLGWEPQVRLEAGLTATIEYYKTL